MTTPPGSTTIRFDDGASYEEMMGRWSRLAGDVFLDWLAAPPGLRWLDVGCGNGAFTEAIVERCKPGAVDGIDPSDGQLGFARARPATRSVRYQRGDAMALPYADAQFDAAVMALVIFFVPDPAKGVAEMRRVVNPGGLVAAYAWDMHGGGFPLDILGKELRAMGAPVPKPPSVDASRIEAMRELWREAELVDIETRQIAVSRRFDDFDHWWRTAMLSASLGQRIAQLAPADTEWLKARAREQLVIAPDSSVTGTGRANAVKGRRRSA
jgi:ubiquinone/menaquinone biosynthesis C-methylase UbiE